MTLVLSDEPKAIFEAARRLMELSPNISRIYTHDRLVSDLKRYMREMKRSSEPTYTGTAGYTVFYWPYEEDADEFMICLNVASLHGPFENGEDQQFVYDSDEWRYDESCPTDWHD